MEPASRTDRTLKAIIVWVGALITYFSVPNLLVLGTNRMPYTTLDDIIPFLPWTLIIYVTLYFQVWIVFLCARNRIILKKLFLVYMIATAFMTVVYWTFPTIHEYRPSLDGLSLFGFERIVQILRGFDVNGNQFPSGHAVYSLIGPIFYLAMGYKKRGWLLVVWSILLALSAITTKQHNAIDILISWPFAFLGGWLFGKSALRELKRFGSKPV